MAVQPDPRLEEHPEYLASTEAQILLAQLAERQISG
jgi:hypothetical protein